MIDLDLSTTDSDATDPEFSTPMMLQYFAVKKKYQDCLLWFRLGDFYEMFLEDAKIGSRVLGIVLTSRARGKDGKIPMCGIPYHAADSYLGKLIKAGHKVAICEQLTQPDGKNLVQREVIRIVTPGTVLDEKNLDRKQHNYVISLVIREQILGVAATDLSTGDLQANQFSLSEQYPLAHWLSKIFTQLQPSECLVAPAQLSTFQKQQEFKYRPQLTVFEFADWEKWTKHAEKTIKNYFSFSQQQKNGLSKLPIAEVATAALLGYLQHTQKTIVTHLHSIQLLLADDYLKMDRSTIDNLELFQPLSHQHETGCLLNVIDHTRTAMGGRLLRQWLLQPLVDQEKIEARLASVEFFLQQLPLRTTLLTNLTQMNDLERMLSRLSVKLGNPKDVMSLAESLTIGLQLRETLEKFTNKLPLLLQQLGQEISPTLAQLVDQIQKTLVTDPPFDAKQGGLIQAGLHPELDELRQIIDHSRDWIAQLELAEKQRTGISSLKIKFNQVFGFYIEISNANLHLAPSDYQRKQTLVNGERFITPELKKHEQLILTAEEKSHQIEYRLFEELVTKILREVTIIQTAANAIAQCDCLLSLAEVAEDHDYVRPRLNRTGELELRGSRHPVVEQLIESHRFVPNDVSLNETDRQLLLLTGPNMAGKSVVMRQVALIVLMAHLGSFVPATSANISLTDQIFVRSGAADMISAGLSTFMVEMVETAYILQHATADSFIIMDEIGRGTSTYDGISIAWAVAEQLVQNQQSDKKSPRGPKTLFATHYHELQALATEFPHKIHNYQMAIAEHESKPVFLYQLQAGAASHSFGIAVAELAGVPEAVITRAKTLLTKYEKNPNLTR